MDWIAFIQWPAMVVSVLAAYLVGSHGKRRRTWGFWCFLLSNVLWVVWGWNAGAWALIALQVFLAVLNIRGVFTNAPADSGNDASESSPRRAPA